MSPAIVWLPRADFLAEIAAAVLPRERPQLIALPLAVADLTRALPVLPVENPEDGGFPGPVRRWYGRVADRRYFTLDVYFDHGTETWGSSCVVTISYSPAGGYDWHTLYDLAGLSGALRVDAPEFVQSRTLQPTHDVYRRDARGFDAPIYSAASHDDGASLLAHLNRHANTSGYFLGNSDPRGEWVIVDESPSPHVVGCYPDRATSLSLACELSADNGKILRVRCETPGLDDRHYLVRGGRVVGP